MISFSSWRRRGGAEVLLEYLYGGPYSEASERDGGLFLAFGIAAMRDGVNRALLGKAC